MVRWGMSVDTSGPKVDIDLRAELPSLYGVFNLSSLFFDGRPAAAVVELAAEAVQSQGKCPQTEAPIQSRACHPRRNRASDRHGYGTLQCRRPSRLRDADSDLATDQHPVAGIGHPACRLRKAMTR
jgi:hypothetical protein